MEIPRSHHPIPRLLLSRSFGAYIIIIIIPVHSMSNSNVLIINHSGIIRRGRFSNFDQKSPHYYLYLSIYVIYIRSRDYYTVSKLNIKYIIRI